MGRMHKTILAAVCGLAVVTGCASGPGKTSWWQFSWKMPTVKLPTFKNPFHRENEEEKALAVLEQDRQKPEAELAKAPGPERRPQPPHDALAAKVPAPSLQPGAPVNRAALPSLPAEQSKPGVVVAQEVTKTQPQPPTVPPTVVRPAQERLAVTQPKPVEALHHQGQAAAREGHYQEAEGLYTQALAIAPRNAEVLNDLGYCLYCQGKLPQAETMMLKAVALQPSDPQLRTNLGVIYGHQGRPREALEQFRLAGSEADACTNLAEILMARNDRAAAKDYLRQALAAEPNHARAQKALEALAQQEPPQSEIKARMAKFPSALPPKVTR